jgi:hypothetical protein
MSAKDLIKPFLEKQGIAVLEMCGTMRCCDDGEAF